MNLKKGKQILLYISIGLFLLSLSQEAYCTQKGDGEFVMGYECFVMGLIGFLYGGAELTWLTNPILFVSWFLSKTKMKLAIVISGIAFCVSISFLFFNKIVVNEGGSYSEIIGYGIGYWLWVLSTLIFFVGNSYIIYKQKYKNPAYNNA